MYYACMHVWMCTLCMYSICMHVLITFFCPFSILKNVEGISCFASIRFFAGVHLAFCKIYNPENLQTLLQTLLFQSQGSLRHNIEAKLLCTQKVRSYRHHALRAIEPYLVQSVVYDVCPNDCVIFRNECASLSECPKCGGSRYIGNSSLLPARPFTYLPLKSRLSCLFGTSNTAQILQSHAVVRESAGTSMYDIHQCDVWNMTLFVYSKVIIEEFP